MKNTLKVLGIIAFIAVIGFTFTACKGAEEPTSTTYTSVGSDGNTYELVITKDPNRAAYTPQAGDSYVLTITFTDGTKKTSSGKVESGSVDSGFTLKPAVEGAATFTVTVSSEKMTEISGTIATDQGNVTAPPTIFAVTKDSAKIVTITGLPNEKTGDVGIFALLEFKDDWKAGQKGGTGKVTGNSVAIQLWDNAKDVAYTGTGKFYIIFFRFKDGAIGGDLDADIYHTKGKVDIKSANTTVAWSEFVNEW